MASIQCYIDPNRLKIMDPNQIEKMILINLLRKRILKLLKKVASDKICWIRAWYIIQLMHSFEVNIRIC